MARMVADLTVMAVMAVMAAAAGGEERSIHPSLRVCPSPIFPSYSDCSQGYAPLACSPPREWCDIDTGSAIFVQREGYVVRRSLGKFEMIIRRVGGFKNDLSARVHMSFDKENFPDIVVENVFFIQAPVQYNRYLPAKAMNVSERNVSGDLMWWHWDGRDRIVNIPWNTSINAGNIVRGFQVSLSHENGTDTREFVIFDDISDTGLISFASLQLEAYEGVLLPIDLQRKGGALGKIEVSLQVDTTSPGCNSTINNDFSLLNSTVTWSNGDQDPKTVLLLINDDEATSFFERNFCILLVGSLTDGYSSTRLDGFSAIDPQRSKLHITLLDNDLLSEIQILTGEGHSALNGVSVEVKRISGFSKYISGFYEFYSRDGQKYQNSLAWDVGSGETKSFPLDEFPSLPACNFTSYQIRVTTDKPQLSQSELSCSVAFHLRFITGALVRGGSWAVISARENCTISLSSSTYQLFTNSLSRKLELQVCRNLLSCSISASLQTEDINSTYGTHYTVFPHSISFDASQQLCAPVFVDALPANPDYMGRPRVFKLLLYKDDGFVPESGIIEALVAISNAPVLSVAPLSGACALMSSNAISFVSVVTGDVKRTLSASWSAEFVSPNFISGISLQPSAANFSLTPRNKSLTVGFSLNDDGLYHFGQYSRQIRMTLKSNDALSFPDPFFSSTTVTLVNDVCNLGVAVPVQAVWIYNRTSPHPHVVVNRIDGYEGTLRVRYRAMDGTAINHRDFEVEDGILVWEELDTSTRTINLTFNDVMTFSAGACYINFTLQLYSFDGCVFNNVSYQSTEIRINRDDHEGLGIVGFRESLVEMSQDSFSFLTVERTCGDVGNVTVFFQGVGYEVGSLRWEEGDSSSKTIRFSSGTSTSIPAADWKTSWSQQRFICQGDREAYYEYEVSLSYAYGSFIDPTRSKVLVRVYKDGDSGIISLTAASTFGSPLSSSLPFFLINVSRTVSAGSATVRYVAGGGGAQSCANFVPVVGTRLWSENQFNVQQVKVPIRQPFVVNTTTCRVSVVLERIHDGTSLSATNFFADFWFKKNDLQPGKIVFENSAVEVKESEPEVILFVNRIDGRDGNIRVRYKIESIFSTCQQSSVTYHTTVSDSTGGKNVICSPDNTSFCINSSLSDSCGGGECQIPVRSHYEDALLYNHIKAAGGLLEWKDGESDRKYISIKLFRDATVNQTFPRAFLVSLFDASTDDPACGSECLPTFASDVCDFNTWHHN
eukprot:766386-Hanusia_phi.AAC.1